MPNEQKVIVRVSYRLDLVVVNRMCAYDALVNSRVTYNVSGSPALLMPIYGDAAGQGRRYRGKPGMAPWARNF